MLDYKFHLGKGVSTLIPAASLGLASAWHIPRAQYNVLNWIEFNSMRTNYKLDFVFDTTEEAPERW